MDLEREIAGLVRALGREIEVVHRIGIDALAPARGDLCRIRQTCPLCDIALDSVFVLDGETTEAWVHRELFALYDRHRCVTAEVSLEEQYERAERESVRCGERVLVLQRGLPGDRALIERAERESIKMAERAQALRRQL